VAVKIKDVAEKAGVSVTSVSRVLNGGKYVREEVRQRILKAVNDLGYSPSFIARSLVLQRTNLIGIIVPDLTSSFHATILSSIEEVASNKGYNILVSNLIEDLAKEVRYLDIFRQMRVSGLIIMHEKVNEAVVRQMRKMEAPIVFSSVKDFTSININDRRAAKDATDYLIRLGHSQIAFIGGDLRDVTSGQSRYQGYRDAMEGSGLRVEDRLVRFGDYKVGSGYRLMTELLASEPFPTAVFAVSDDMAAGALNCIHDHGLKVPCDISVMGFDGSYLTELVRPRLTSMEQPIREIGALSIETLIRKIENGAGNMNEIIMHHRLVERDSCRPPVRKPT
jgi:LacI family transcriptional regulator